MSDRSYRFSHAIARLPSRSSVNGLRAVDTGAPDYEVFCEHHQHYVDVLASTGATVTLLSADEAYPDSVFVEDTALCLREAAILMRPGAESRLGEIISMKSALEALYADVLCIEGQGHIEGGDILTTEREILVGLSARTDEDGVRELTTHVSHWGYRVRVVNTPPDILHFKTDCSVLDEETVLSTPQLAATGCFDGYRVLPTAHNENACANAIRFNDVVMVPEGFPRTADTLDAHGYDVVVIGNSEAAKLDGGMSCMSLRFTPA